MPRTPGCGRTGSWAETRGCRTGFNTVVGRFQTGCRAPVATRRATLLQSTVTRRSGSGLPVARLPASGAVRQRHALIAIT
jgi:hypothetical protein